jgi:hypothetical protein
MQGRRSTAGQPFELGFPKLGVLQAVDPRLSNRRISSVVCLLAWKGEGFTHRESRIGVNSSSVILLPGLARPLLVRLLL